MDYAQLIQLYFDRSNALQWYWTLYVVVAGGLLAFSSLRVRRDFVTGILVTVLFCCFAYKNCGAIVETSNQRIATLTAIRQYAYTGQATVPTPTVRNLLEPTLVVPDIGGVRIFHVSCDLLTIAALWAMELRRVRQARETATGLPRNS